ncbi:hypothetical protein ACU4GI_26265 [Cupriavidus basilensis]
MPLPTTRELIASLDEELVDLLSERMRLTAFPPTVGATDDAEQYVQHMRTLAATYHVSPDLIESGARPILEAEGYGSGDGR